MKKILPKNKNLQNSNGKAILKTFSLLHNFPRLLFVIVITAHCLPDDHCHHLMHLYN